MSLESDFKQFSILHAKYEARALRMLLREFRDMFGNIKFDNLSLDLKISQAVIELNLNDKELERILYKLHYTTGLEYGRIESKKLRVENPITVKKFKPLSFFNVEFQKYLLAYFRSYGGEMITSLTATMVETVIDEIKKATELNETVQQMRKRIKSTVTNRTFYNWQALRIARTETSIAMNSAKELSGITSGVKMDKIWIARLDGRERQSHMDANQQVVDQNELFKVGGYKMKYPCDRSQGAPGKEIISCRCSYGYKAKRLNGRLQFNDDEEIEKMLEQMRK